MKKRLTGIFLCFMMLCATIFSGCTLVTRDQKVYLGQVAATATNKETNETITITMKDLIAGYNSYGYYYEEYYNYSHEDAVKETVNLLLKRRITVKASEEIYSNGLDAKEKTYLWQKTSDSLQNNLISYVNKRLGKNDNKEEEKENSDVRSFAEYQKTIQLSADGEKFEKLTSVQYEIDNFNYDSSKPHDASVKEDKELIYTNFLSFVNDSGSTIYKDAFNDYLKQLKKNETGLNLSTKTQEVFIREIERLYDVNYENYMITKYDENYMNTSPYAAVTVQNVLDLYAGQVRAAYTQYMVEEDSNYESDMQGDPSTIMYYKEGGDDTKFFQVAHVLFQFDKEKGQDKKYAEIEEKHKNNRYSLESAYQQALADLVSEVVPKVHEVDGKTLNYICTDASQADQDGEKMFVSSQYEKNATTLANYIKTQVSYKNSAQEKAALFRDFIYMYNDDPGMIKGKDSYVMGYSIGVNRAQAKEGEEFKVYSNYVQNFTDAAVELYKKGEVGGVSDYVVTENGVHVLFYMGTVDNLFTGIESKFSLKNDYNETTKQTPIQRLASTRVNIFSERTYLDVLFDTLNVDNFTTFINNKIENLTNQYDMNDYPDVYNQLTKK